MPYRKIKVNRISHILYLPGGQRIITYSWGDGSFQVWDLERGTKVGEEWEDKERGVFVIALSPSSKTIASGSSDGTVRLWNVDMGKVIKKWTGHIVWVRSVCWSPNAMMIATGGDNLKIWDANTGNLLKTFEGEAMCLKWTSDGKTLIAGGSMIKKFDTATWTVLDLRKKLIFAHTAISLSPNERILASKSSLDNTVQLWNLKTNQPIRTPLHHEGNVDSVTFSADGKFLATSCHDSHIYTWDVSAVVKKAGLLSDIADATPKPPPKMKGARYIPPGLFDDALREANLRTRLSQCHRPHNQPTPALRQRTPSHFPLFWPRSKLHGATERNIQSRSGPLSWTRDLSGILCRRDGSDIQLREIEVPCTAGKPRNYHTRRRPAASSSRPHKIHTTQQPSATTQSTPPSSQQPPPTATALTLSAAAGTPGTMGAPSRPNITIRDSGWRTRLMLWVCYMPIQNTDGQH